MKSQIRIGIIGFGVMGKTHAKAIVAAEKDGLPVELAAVTDSDLGRLKNEPSKAGNLGAMAGAEPIFDPARVRAFATPQELFQYEKLDAVVIATPTDTHEQLAIQAVQAGLHVLLEKPVALTLGEIERMAAAERSTGKRIIPAMVMRFWPAWPLLRECIRDRRYGRLVAARFTRLGSRPQWSPFYADPSRCGGALADLHVHDADYLLHAIGAPREVLSVGHLDHIMTVYRFGEADGPSIVSAEGGWLPSTGRAFRMRYTAEFERATMEWDLARSPATAVLVTMDGATTSPELPSTGPYDAQMRHFVELVQGWQRGSGAPAARCTLDDALHVTRLLDAERRSLRSGTWERV